MPCLPELLTKNDISGHVMKVCRDEEWLILQCDKKLVDTHEMGDDGR